VVVADDIAAHLDVTNVTVNSWISARRCHPARSASLWKFHAGEVDAWVRSGGAAASGETSPSD
jgi:hypothetical protein